MKSNALVLALLTPMFFSALVACSNKKDDPKPAPTATPENAPHSVSECPDGVEGFYKNNSQAPDSFRYFSIHKNDVGVLLFNQSPSAKRDDKTDIPVNGQKKSFPEDKKEYSATCSNKAIRVESFRDGVLARWTTISFGENKASVLINLVNFVDGKPSSVTVLPLEFEKSSLPPERAEEPVMPGIDKNGCPNDILGKYASREEQLYLKFTRNESGTLVLAASSFTAEYPAVELNNAPKSDGDEGTVTGECASGLISVVAVNGNGDTSTLQVKKTSDKILDVKKLKNGKTVKSDTYDKIR